MKTIAKNDQIEIVTGARRYNAERVLVHASKVLDMRADFAKEMIRSYGIIAGRPGREGEATTKDALTIQAPAEVVARACDIADLAFAEFDRRGWLLTLLDYADLTAIED